jgi:hypothetical protein
MKRFTCSTLLISLVIICFFFNSCKKKDETPHPYTIGQTYGGGIIFYIDQTFQHGLVCASTDQSDGIVWQTEPLSNTNVTNTSIGSGQSNTNSLVTILGPGSYAATICHDLVLNGFSDWFLPSKNEALTMYNNLSGLGIGNFNSGMGVYYWSSSEIDIYNVWGVSFYSLGGGIWSLTKSWGCRVRAVRAF